MKLHKIALAIVLGAAGTAASVAENPSLSPRCEAGRTPPAETKARGCDRDGGQGLQILQPKFGAAVRGTDAVRAVLAGGEGVRPDSVRITLNGKKVRPITKEGCKDHRCEWTAELRKEDGLRSGTNELRAAARGQRNDIELARVSFDYSNLVGESPAPYLPSAVGLSLNPGGAQPWVTLTTGTPASLQDNLDPTKYSLPYRDTTFPAAGTSACSSRYQVVVLDRFTPAIQDDYYCANDSATLKSYLAGMPAGARIVLVGTTEHNSADSSLDTSNIGGTDYSHYPSAWQPLGYAAIGVPGAAPGSAYEDYYLAGDIGKTYQQEPFANGLLAKDGNGNYNFHAASSVQFQVYPNNPIFNTSSVMINYSDVGSSALWLPPAGSANGFWLLILDRVRLDPIDVSNQGPCGGGSTFCGTFFPTGNSDANVASQAVANLYHALQTPTTRQLVVLTTVGQPFQSASLAADLIPPMSSYGGAGYRFDALTNSGSTYTLISPGIQNPTGALPGPKSPFSTGVVNSSTVFSLGQGNEHRQTGIVRGVMVRNNNSLYFPTVVSQYDPSADQNGNPSTVSIDYDFYAISTQMPIDWPLTDSSGHIAAYHYASQQFLSNRFTETGSNSADLRYFYTNPGYTTRIGGHNGDFQCSQNPNIPNCVYPGDGGGFTQQELADANAQLYLETTALSNTDAYLGDNGIGGVIKSTTTGSGLSDQVITASYEVLNGQVGATAGTGVSASAYDWMNLLAGLTSVGAAALGPADVPYAAATIGVTSGLLWTGSALDPWFSTNASTPPSYENTFDTTLGNLQENETTYATNLAESYGTALDDIYTDWGKFSIISAKTSDSDSGWSFNDEVTSVTAAGRLVDGVRRSMYLQLLPKFYWADTYSQQPVANVSQLGTFQTVHYDGFHNACTASYPASTSSNGLAFSVFASPSNPAESDMYVMGGEINNQNTPQVTESLPSAELLDTLFSAPVETNPSPTGPLDIPQELVYGTAALPGRGGPSQGTYFGISQCYKPGCSDLTGNPADSSCIKP